MSSVLEANLLALHRTNPQLYSRFASHRHIGAGHYTFVESRSGEIVPSQSLSGNPQPLHSLIDPKREAERLVSTIPGGTGFVVFLGLGGGFAPRAALANTATQVTVIDFDLDGIAELFRSIDYTALIKNERFNILIDPACDEIKNFILEQYKPALHGGIKVIPLRTRTEQALSVFDKAAASIHQAIEESGADYSVQAHFGQRWFSNIIRNMKIAETANQTFTKAPIREAAIIAAGPSLDTQIPVLAESKHRTFIICSDTALPVLLHNHIKPDVVVSIDCQHISHYHFFGCDLRNIPLVLDITSPPLLASLAPSAVFFSGGHPLASYISRHWRSLPPLDTSGGNVTYACLSLAETLGARSVTLFGADFSYVGSRTYARGTYIYPFFEKNQTRLSPLEAMHSAFLFRSPFLPKEPRQNYLETASLRFYRKKLEEKASAMNARIIVVKGDGAEINIEKKRGMRIREQGMGESSLSCVEFLERYRADIAGLPAASGERSYLGELNGKEKQVFTTLLPSVAAFKYRNPLLKTKDLIEEVKLFCIREIDKFL